MLFFFFLMFLHIRVILRIIQRIIGYSSGGTWDLTAHIWGDFQVSQTFCWCLPMENMLTNKREGEMAEGFISPSPCPTCHAVTLPFDERLK